MTRRPNPKREAFLHEINSLASIERNDSDHTSRCKFNFSYFTVQDAGQDFYDWTKPQLEKLLESLRDFSKKPLRHWRSLPVKGGPPIFSIYGAFPNNSRFSNPPHVPHQAEWGRFRLGAALRLVGFIIPEAYDAQVHPITQMRFDCNTFYVVFLDAEHRFYLTNEGA